MTPIVSTPLRYGGSKGLLGAAGAAKQVAEQRSTTVGAVASRRAAELYNLDVLDEGIQDCKDNVTRFIVLARCGLPQAWQRLA